MYGMVVLGCIYILKNIIRVKNEIIGIDNGEK